MDSIADILDSVAADFTENASSIRNETDDSQSSSTDTYRTLSFFCSFAMIVVSAVGILGNGVAIFHFGRRSCGRSSINVLLTTLSAFDLLMLLTGAPLYSLNAIYAYTRDPLTLTVLEYSTTALYPLSHMAQTGGVMTMMLISLERYMGVCHPFFARRELTVRRARLCAVCVAMFACMYNVCRFWEYTLADNGDLAPLLRNDTLYLEVYSHWMYVVVIFTVPFSFIVIFNFLVVLGVRKAALNRPRCQLSAQQRGERRTTIMLLVVVAVFLFCNSLPLVLNAAEVFGYVTASAADFEFVTDLNNLLVMTHPLLNIIVYTSFSSKFRREFVDTVFKKGARRASTASQQSYYYNNELTNNTCNQTGSTSLPLIMRRCNKGSNGRTVRYSLDSTRKKSSTASIASVEARRKAFQTTVWENGAIDRNATSALRIEHDRRYLLCTAKQGDLV